MMIEACGNAKGKPAIFLDRDGTINIEKNYLYKIEEWGWISGSIEAIKIFNRLGFLVVVVTNQAGIARGLYKKQDVERLHTWVQGELAKAGARVDAFYICPHHPEYGEIRNCACRKPLPGLFRQAMNDFGIDPSRSYLIGDKQSDIKAADAAGVNPILVLTGYGEQEDMFVSENVPRASDVLEAARILEEKYRGAESRGHV